jgi:hypothetical protein
MNTDATWNAIWRADWLTDTELAGFLNDLATIR